MTPERMAKLVARWLRLYTRNLPQPIARRRIEEIDADLHDHIAHERALANKDGRIGVAAMVFGESDDAPGLVLFGLLLVFGTVALTVRTALRSE